MSVTTSLPHWDMTVVYPGLDSSEFDEDFHSIIRGISELSDLFDRYHIEAQPQTTVDASTVDVFETVLKSYAQFVERLLTLQAYIHSFVSTDSRDDVAQARLSELEQHTVLLSQLGTRFTAWIGSLNIAELIDRSSTAKEHSFMLEKAKVRSEHLMSQPEEMLAAELNIVSGTAWSKLHGNVTSQLMVTIQLDGESRVVPMSAARNLASDSDREVRRSAFEAEIAAWETVDVPLAAAINSIKGETNTLSAHRRWDSALDLGLFINNIDRQTLDSMLAAATASFPDFRRYLRAKARALGLPALAWYDLFAPLGESNRVWSFGEAADFLLEQFGTYSSRLRDLAARAFRDRWIDAEPREGKEGGAYCMRLRGDESRILANFNSSYDGMSTLAHELGHAYHSYNLARQPFLLRSAPMALAETASIFCETIVREAALGRSDREEQLAILEASLQNECQIVVDISSRFLFESRLLDARQQRELSVDELKSLMLQAQRETYGDGLDQSTFHHYMWAVKGHYYSVGGPYYNFPYMFGLLFGLGLYARFRQDPERFKSGYDDLLASTGLADAASLTARFGIDIRSPEFWNSSLDIIRGDIDRFVTLVDDRASSA